ncbi:MAG TPA: hypothetical protein VFL91_10275 [Thermomicrobiales bacterium]|nr:hypothetical protein [Thermomicrobiales bacterium]
MSATLRTRLVPVAYQCHDCCRMVTADEARRGADGEFRCRVCHALHRAAIWGTREHNAARLRDLRHRRREAQP